MVAFLLDRVQLDLNLDSILAEEFTFDVGSLLVFIENVENEKSDGQRSLAVIPVCSVKASRS